MSNIKKRSFVIIICLITLFIIWLRYLWILSVDTRILREQFMIQNALRMTGIAYFNKINGLQEKYHNQNLLLNNIDSSDTEPLLSWRVDLLQYSPEHKSQALFIKFNLKNPWNGEQNKDLLQLRPSWYYYPYYMKEQQKTCILGIEEIMQLPQIPKVQEIVRDKAIIIVCSHEFAVEWTSPVDISWKDLANGKIKPYLLRKNYLCYIKAGNGEFTSQLIPKSFAEWQVICGLTEEEQNNLSTIIREYYLINLSSTISENVKIRFSP
jgi:hypothetical protein